ncbi:HPr family phosphocarrier protein [Ferruginivarius sediminum]|uniref:HPr family phosphocarrier protein n=1 Tax=Ferruginivarius sediminum TaxID=2661937 RepID=A0A369TBN0_9PROT|nr:HPr family phosphocarrier protein [Ferruginivarius sediminum]RDD60336.1 HPr family phosphocarrier protein [Ferruginivarius sediminum]
MSDAAVPEPNERSVSICNRRGLHARAAAKFVRTVEAFDAKVVVVKDGVEVPGNSIMGLMMLAAGPGTELRLRAAGAQAARALDALEDLIARRFDEDA